MKAMKDATRKKTWGLLLLWFFTVAFQLVDAVCSLPEWDPGFFYLIEGRVRIFLPLAIVLLMLFIVFLIYDICLSRREMAERERYYAQRQAEREAREKKP